MKGWRDTVAASPERITVYPQERDPHSKPRFGGGVSLKDSIRNEKRLLGKGWDDSLSRWGTLHGIDQK